MTNDYVLGNQKNEIERLDIQASFFKPFAEDALIKAGIKQGMRCIDVGCGSGSVIKLLTEMVGPKGHVTGIDIDEKYLQYCRSTIVQPNVDLIHGDISSVDINGDFDIAYSRFMFLHLKDPRTAVRSMKKQIREGGSLVIQELDHSPDSWLCYPENESVNILRELFITLVKKMGGDPLAGRKLYGLLVDESFDTSVECYSPCLMMGHEPHCSLGWRIADSLKPMILQHGLLNEKEYDRLFYDLKELSRKKGSFVTYARFFSVIGRK